MINNTFKTRDFLQIFDLISTKGIKSEGSYEFLGIRAWHDFDGYTCWLAYNDLTVTLLFHGKFSVEYKHEETFTKFKRKVNSLMAQH
ncbi:MAG: hypothetical protein ACI9LM_001570 [Alteromonadaceae bacterium]|jgi:hypothetical protein